METTTITVLPPAIKQKFNRYLLLSAWVLIEERRIKIERQARKRFKRGSNRYKKFYALNVAIEVLYGRASVEKASFKEAAKEGSYLSNE